MNERDGWNNEILEAAVRMAIRVHEGQLRKGTRIPYIAHPLAVAALVLEAGGNLDAAVAALLHDTVEDGKGCRTALRGEILERFGTRVLELVRRLTKPEEWDCSAKDGRGKGPRTDDLAEWRERKRPYLEQVTGALPEVRLIALADKLHNARALLADYREVGEALWERFNGPREGTLWYYRELVEVFRAEPPHKALFEEFERTVGTLLEAARGKG